MTIASAIEESFRACRLCPRDCGVDRNAGQAGVCVENAGLRIASYGPHMGEEPFISGTQGSGTFFFSGCPCHCIFCQNWQISSPGGMGEGYDAGAFHHAAVELLARGVHNLNFVTPDHVWPHIEVLCRRLRAEGCTVPFVFNSSGYHRLDMVERYAEWMDIFLPDFKFAMPELAQSVMRDERYPALAVEALRRMVEVKGFLEPFEPEKGVPAERGVLVRHLVLPGHVDNSIAVLDVLKKEFGRFLPLSLMSQYTPVPAVGRQAPFDRPLAGEQYQSVVDYAIQLGFENVLIQPLEPDDSAFLPDFTRQRPFSGNPV